MKVLDPLLGRMNTDTFRKSLYSFLRGHSCLNQQALERLRGSISKDFKISRVTYGLAQPVCYVARLPQYN